MNKSLIVIGLILIIITYITSKKVRSKTRNTDETISRTATESIMQEVSKQEFGAKISFPEKKLQEGESFNIAKDKKSDLSSKKMELSPSMPSSSKSVMTPTKIEECQEVFILDCDDKKPGIKINMADDYSRNQYQSKEEVGSEKEDEDHWGGSDRMENREFKQHNFQDREHSQSERIQNKDEKIQYKQRVTTENYQNQQYQHEFKKPMQEQNGKENGEKLQWGLNKQYLDDDDGTQKKNHKLFDDDDDDEENEFEEEYLDGLHFNRKNGLYKKSENKKEKNQEQNHRQLKEDDEDSEDSREIVLNEEENYIHEKKAKNKKTIKRISKQRDDEKENKYDIEIKKLKSMLIKLYAEQYENKNSHHKSESQSKRIKKKNSTKSKKLHKASHNRSKSRHKKINKKSNLKYDGKSNRQ